MGTNGKFEERVVSALIKLFAERKIDCQSMGIFFETQDGEIFIRMTDAAADKIPKAIKHVCDEAIVFIKGKASKRSLTFDHHFAQMLGVRSDRFRGSENKIIMMLISPREDGLTEKCKKRRDETHRLSSLSKKRKYC